MKKSKQRSLGIKISLLSIVFSLVAIFLLYEVLSINSLKTSHDDGVVYTQEEVNELVEEAKQQGRESVLLDVKNALVEGNSVLSVLKRLYPDQLVVASGGLYHWVDIIEDLTKHDYSIDNIVENEETGEYQYVVNGEVKSVKGIDVSSHQGKIDWNKVAADGVEFAFVRGVYRGYGSGKIVIDDYCKKNINGAQAAGIDVGVYVFSQAISEKEAIEEANEVLNLLDGKKLELPIVFDVERVTSNDARMNTLTVEERTAVTLAFLHRIEEAGYETMVYHNTEMGSLLIDMTQLEEYPKWFAGYNKEFYWPYDFKIWQYSEKGSVNGIKGNVDMDIMLK